MKLFQRELRDISFVDRWAIVRTVRRQNVAEHGYFVVLYTDRLMTLMGWTLHDARRAAALRWAVYHDTPENGTGDICAPVKKELTAQFKQLDGADHLRDPPFETVENNFLSSRFGTTVPTSVNFCEAAVAVVKVADWLDSVYFICTEIQMGNGSVGHPIFAAPNRYFDKDSVAKMCMAGLTEAWKLLSPYWENQELSPDGAFSEVMIPSIFEALERPSRTMGMKI